MRKPLLKLLSLLVVVVTTNVCLHSLTNNTAVANTLITLEEQGQYKTVSGRVIFTYITKDGCQIIKLLAGKTYQSIRVLIFSDLNYDRQISLGDKIQIYGIVFDHHGEFEMIPPYPNNVVILHKFPKYKLLLVVIIGVASHISIRTLGRKNLAS